MKHWITLAIQHKKPFVSVFVESQIKHIFTVIVLKNWS